MVTGFNAFRYFSHVITMREVDLVVVFKTKSLKSGGENFNKNCLIYSFLDKSNLNEMYPNLRLGSQMKITFLLSKFFSIKLSFLLFKNLIKNFKSLLNFTV